MSSLQMYWNEFDLWDFEAYQKMQKEFWSALPYL